VKGRKRHILVDTLGLLIVAVVHAADIQDRDGAKFVFRRIKKYLLRLQVVWADGGYAGKLVLWVNRYCSWKLEIVKRSDKVKGFKVIPKRWIVERTFSWFENYRRLSKDYEYRIDTSETMLYVAMIHVMVRRLA